MSKAPRAKSQPTFLLRARARPALPRPIVHGVGAPPSVADPIGATNVTNLGAAVTGIGAATSNSPLSVVASSAAPVTESVPQTATVVHGVGAPPSVADPIGATNVTNLGAAVTGVGAATSNSPLSVVASSAAPVTESVPQTASVVHGAVNSASTIVSGATSAGGATSDPLLSVVASSVAPVTESVPQTATVLNGVVNSASTIVNRATSAGGATSNSLLSVVASSVAPVAVPLPSPIPVLTGVVNSASTIVSGASSLGAATSNSLLPVVAASVTPVTVPLPSAIPLTGAVSDANNLDTPTTMVIPLGVPSAVSSTVPTTPGIASAPTSQWAPPTGAPIQSRSFPEVVGPPTPLSPSGGNPGSVFDGSDGSGTPLQGATPTGISAGEHPAHATGLTRDSAAPGSTEFWSPSTLNTPTVPIPPHRNLPEPPGDPSSSVAPGAGGSQTGAGQGQAVPSEIRAITDSGSQKLPRLPARAPRLIVFSFPQPPG